MHPFRFVRVTAVAVAIVAVFASTAPSSSLATPPTPGAVELPKAPTCFGEYRNAADPNERIVLEPVGDPTVVRIRTSAGWGAVGYIDADHFEGVMRAADMQGAPLPGRFGTLTFDVEADGSVRAALRIGADALPQRWLRGPDVDDALPEFGEYVDDDELPVAIRSVEPTYPPAARKAGIEGTVMVLALVTKDGNVRDARIVKSIPQLDAAALAAVQQWKFEPARSKGRPVARWVAVPVRFTLK